MFLQSGWLIPFHIVNDVMLYNLVILAEKLHRTDRAVKKIGRM